MAKSTRIITEQLICEPVENDDICYFSDKGRNNYKKKYKDNKSYEY